ncbi:MAG: hypothetical protein WC238_06215 [Parcubacteria group bacterium]|jgi:hypothetical protein
MSSVNKLLKGFGLPSPQEAWERISKTLVNEDSLALEQGKLEKTIGTLQSVEKKAKRLRIKVNDQEFYGLREDETRREWRIYFNEAKDNIGKEAEVEYRREIMGASELVKELFFQRLRMELPGVYNRIVSINYRDK